MNPSVEFRHIDKKFVGVHALKDVSLECYPGQVHVLQGENGAGKSTLLKVFTGIYSADGGEVLIDGEVTTFKHTIEARKNRVAMVYQEMSLLPQLTVAQNIFLNSESFGKVYDEKKIIGEALKLAEKYDIEIDPYALAGDMPIGTQQMIEILKALAIDPKVLILDEPTSALTVKEVEKLYTIVQELKKENKTIIFISHRLAEVFKFGDQVSVLKDGEKVATVNIDEVTEDDIIQLMVGRKLENIFPPKEENPGKVIFEIQNYGDGNRVEDINIAVREREIVGIGALEGQGQSQLFSALAGVTGHSTGKVFLNGDELHYRSVGKAISLGIGYVPEDRKVQGLCLEMSCKDNLSLASLKQHSKATFIDRKKEREDAAAMAESMNVKMSSLEQLVGRLSGGNQQKIAIGKSLEAKPKVLLLNEPTRGIDVEAKQEIYVLMRKLAEEGVAILCYTSDMMETIGLCDKVVTMYEGRVTGELVGEEITEDSIIRGAMNQNKDTKQEVAV